MSEVRRVLLVGATGLVGRKLIGLGRNVPGLKLVALARRELPLPRGSRMELMLAPNESWGEAIATIRPDAVICALGTTRAKAGKEGQEAVDRALVLRVAQAAREAGAQQFVMVSSVGADAHSKSFYLRLKGEAEEGLRRLRFARLDIMRPGLLRGARHNDRRGLEGLGQIMSPLFDLLLHGSKTRYRSIRAEDVAAACLQAIRTRAQGAFVHEHDAMLRMAQTLRRERGSE